MRKSTHRVPPHAAALQLVITRPLMHFPSVHFHSDSLSLKHAEGLQRQVPNFKDTASARCATLATGNHDLCKACGFRYWLSLEVCPKYNLVLLRLFPCHCVTPQHACTFLCAQTDVVTLCEACQPFKQPNVGAWCQPLLTWRMLFWSVPSYSHCLFTHL